MSYTNAELRLSLTPELAQKLLQKAERAGISPEEVALALIERQLKEKPNLSFLGAWADSDITAESIIEARTQGRPVELD